MATALTPRFLENVGDQIDDLLMRICRRLQLDDTRYAQAESSYQAVAALLESQAETGFLRPVIYPQGSMLLKTTVRPLLGEEYDLDFVCEFACTTRYFSDPIDALDLIERTLRANLTYAPMVERKNRCIRLNYVNKFHLDVLPACKDSLREGTCILVPDRELRAWTASNPKGYAEWFASCSRRRVVDRLIEKAAPLPPQQGAEVKLPLERCVQLIKRWRDVRYRNNRALAPISIVLTTLAAQNYRGHQSVAAAIAEILSRIHQQSQTAVPRIVVLNPKNLDEDLSERWDDKPGAYREFVRGIGEFEAEWAEVLQARGIDKVAKRLERLFGEAVAKHAVEDHLRDIEAARSRNELGISRASGIITAVSSRAIKPIPRNTFYGDE